jgi:Pentapeptide repeats (8 copies)
MSQQFIKHMTGYKATDENMQCLDLQYTLGEWVEVDGEIEECVSGLHFCSELAHTYLFYPSPTARRFRCEAEYVLKTPPTPRVKEKWAARRLRLTEEVFVFGSGNTGSGNTGNYNSGNYNTGHSNTGNYNTGHSNTGNYNSGNYNTGNYNSGNYNTGHSNTGHSNTGDWNATDFSSGYFCTVEPTVVCFDQDTALTRAQFKKQYEHLVEQLGARLLKTDPIDAQIFSRIPGCTQEKVDELQRKLLNPQ